MSSKCLIDRQLRHLRQGMKLSQDKQARKIKQRVGSTKIGKFYLKSARVQTSAVMVGRDILPWNISVVAEDLLQWKKQGINFDSIDQRIVTHIRQWPKQAANVFCYKYRLLVIYVLMLSMGLRRPLII